MKRELGNLDIHKLLNVLIGFNDLNPKVDELKDGKFKTVSIDLKQLIDAVTKEVLKNTKLNILNTEVNKLESKTSDASILIQIFQYNTDKPNMEKKVAM